MDWQSHHRILGKGRGFPCLLGGVRTEVAEDFVWEKGNGCHQSGCSAQHCQPQLFSRALTLGCRSCATGIRDKTAWTLLCSVHFKVGFVIKQACCVGSCHQPLRDGGCEALHSFFWRVRGEWTGPVVPPRETSFVFHLLPSRCQSVIRPGRRVRPWAGPSVVVFWASPVFRGWKLKVVGNLFPALCGQGLLRWEE